MEYLLFIKINTLNKNQRNGEIGLHVDRQLVKDKTYLHLKSGKFQHQK